jgi:hypothetical protein
MKYRGIDSILRLKIAYRMLFYKIALHSWQLQIMDFESPFSGETEVNIIPAGTDKVFPSGGVGAGVLFTPEPRVIGFGAPGLGAAIFVFEFERNRAEQAGPSFANIACQEEGADVLPNAVVEVGVPALGLVL